MEKSVMAMEKVIAKAQEIDKYAGQQDVISGNVISIIGKMVKMSECNLSSVSLTAKLVQDEYSGIRDISSLGENLSLTAEEITEALKGYNFVRSISGETNLNSVVVFLTDKVDNLEWESITPNEHEEILKDIREEVPRFEALWTNNTDGTFIVSLPSAGLVNARSREWWRRAMSGDVYISETYISAITKRPCQTISVPIRNHNGEITGVLGGDIS
jgi:hypothetical protein